ncbi:MAG TPA: transketolase C-terminal domain-containing protein [Phycisphaerae bacterium]|nr:transketolase C-terminal domain-containing protein [Phycisphaerae bacterium]
MSNWGTTPTLPEILPLGERPLAYSQAVFEAMETALAADERTRLFGEGVTDKAGTYGTTREMAERFGPDRVFDVPTAEQIITGLAIGMSLGGLRPIVIHPRNDFLLVAMDQIANHAAKWKAMFGGAIRLPLTIRSVSCRGWGSAAQHSQALHATMAHMPGLMVATPFTPGDAKGIALWAALEAEEPVMIMEHKWLWNLRGHVPAGCGPTPPAGPQVLRRGDDVTIVGISYGAADALIAAEALAADGIAAEVIDLRWLKPLDVAPIAESVRRTGRLVVVDTGHVSYGAAAEIVAATAERVSPSAMKAAPARVALPDVPAPACSEKTYYPGPKTVADRVRSMLRPAGTRGGRVTTPD